MDEVPEVGMLLDGVRVELRDHDTAWRLAFDQERLAIQQALAPVAPVQVEHIGSTAVPGIRAKPIIDIMVGVETYEPFDVYRAGLEALRYVYDPAAESDDPGRRVFRKNHPDVPRVRTHHLHLTIRDGRYWTRILAFRDHLRRDRQAARDYDQLKVRLASAPDGYTTGKGPFVRRIEARALRDRRARSTP